MDIKANLYAYITDSILIVLPQYRFPGVLALSPEEETVCITSVT